MATPVAPTTITNALSGKGPVNNAVMTGTTTIGNLNVLTGVGTDNPLGLVLAGNGVTTLGMLTVNCDALLTDNLIVNGTIAGYATIRLRLQSICCISEYIASKFGNVY